MIIIGIDLSGPSNHKDTVAAAFQEENGRLQLMDFIKGASDDMIRSLVTECLEKDEVTIGLDAPLSYQDGGGDRAQDKAIRNFIKENGLSGSSIMTPTMTRMVYLTLRGVALSRSLAALDTSDRLTILEVHPGAAIGLRLDEDKKELALRYKREPDVRTDIVDALRQWGLGGLLEMTETHEIDACGAALAAWKYTQGEAVWCWDKKSAAHPFRLCC
ncbi:DUF429 domain-containing protein [Jeotgalibacillus aurantiacus]|uniref:DUF429 domain-containing protein n=1 Tax=Jeotgalibacillus aurantiacus TaxID=2763266 RepID=UPI001D0AAB24|nr:DUF429 domain-containing protein [Jeotgalibacillus aurantiacus]